MTPAVGQAEPSTVYDPVQRPTRPVPVQQARETASLPQFGNTSTNFYQQQQGPPHHLRDLTVDPSHNFHHAQVQQHQLGPGYTPPLVGPSGYNFSNADPSASFGVPNYPPQGNPVNTTYMPYHHPNQGQQFDPTYPFPAMVQDEYNSLYDPENFPISTTHSTLHSLYNHNLYGGPL